ncbi:MAG TPA: ABC transporter permease [Saprospiraceae bacterium]|nr:ABC transporter permease [Saprospiraceae bacterium]HMQ84152.1 ABC transporter permease [Saprospiraceae bacterium]
MNFDYKIEKKSPMFQKDVNVALRQMLKYKGYTAINIFGLAVGIACCLLIIMHLRDELSYDQQHQHLDRLYRVGTSFKTGDHENKTAMSPSPLSWELVEHYPEVEQAARLLKAPGAPQYLVRYEDKSYFELNGLLADSTFFEILTYHFLEGDPTTALNKPFDVVISKPLAEKLFAHEKAIGHTIKIGNQWGEHDYHVSGVFDPSAYPTHVQANFFMNMRSGSVGERFYALDEWAGNNLYYTYLRLKPNASQEALAAKFPALVEEKAGERLRNLGFEKAHFLEPVGDIYLKSDASYPIGPMGDLSFVYIFAAIAIFIVIIACINFMNLTTAKATIRAKEVGIRKVVGATKALLSRQFLTEAFLHTLAAVIAAYFIAQLALPTFNKLANKTLNIHLLNDWSIAVWLLGILIVTSLLAGSYPALYLSSFSPVKIFRGKLGDRFSAKQVRKGLVVLQFIVSIALIQGILVIHQQLEYMRQKELGFEPEGKLLVALNTEKAAVNYQLLKEAFLKNSTVHAVGGTSSAPGLPSVEDMLVYGEGMSQEASVHTMRNWVDPGYLEMMDFELLAGRTFDQDRLADTVSSVVINERLMKFLGYSLNDVVGKRLFWNWDGELHSHEIIGVVKDFHASSLREEMRNYMFSWHPRAYPAQLVASVSTHELATLIKDLDARWSEVNPGEPFDFFFLNETLQQAYINDQRVASLILAFTLLAILISCLGLFGLAAFAAESRTKEIGVRKVLGASISSIVGLLAKEFLWLVLIALVVATPISFYFMNKWLQDFHYHILMPWWAFALAGIMAVIIAFATVSFQSLRAALVNPVKSLKSE